MKKIPMFSSWSLTVFNNLLSTRAKKYLIAALLTGLLVAVVEYTFAIVLQSFFSIMGILSDTQTNFLSSLSFKAIIFILITTGLLRSTTEGFKIFISRMMMQIFANEVRQKIISASLINAAKVSTSKATSLFSDETQRASTGILNLASLSVSMSTSFILFGFSLYSSPKAFSLGLIMLSICYIPVKFFGKRLNLIGQQLSKEWSHTNQTLTDGLRNAFYLRVLGLTNNQVLKANHSLKSYLSIYRKAFIVLSFKSAAPSFFGTIILAYIAWLNFTYQSFGENFQLITFFYIFLRFTQSVSISATLLGDLKINYQSLEAIDDFLLSNPSSTSAKNDTKDKFDIPVDIHVSNLSFAYDNDNNILDNLNFTIEKNSCFAIIGESGSGKSTLLSLLAGLLSPNQGKILLNDNESFLLKEKLANSIGYVGPYPYFVEGSLKDNLIYGHPDASSLTAADFDQVLQAAQLEGFTKNLPLGIDTPIDEKAERLSAGQKQRLMLARALLRNPKILILDEPTSNLDENTEAELIKSLEKPIQETTTILVTHRKNLLSLADQVLHLDTGTVTKL